MWWSAWESVSEVDLEGGAGRGPGAVASPFGVGLDDREVDELGGGLFVGEVAAGLDRLADLAVQALDRVGGVDGASELVGQREERGHVLPTGAPGTDGGRIPLAPLGVEALELGERRLGVRGGVDRAQRRDDLALVAVVDVAQRGADQVHDAGLHPRLGEDRLDGLGEALEAVDAGDQDVLDAAAAQIVEDGQPELGALGFLPPQAEDLALAVAADPQGEVAGAALDRAVLTDLHEHAVEVDDRIDALERPRAPRDHVVEDGVGAPADRVAADVDTVELAQMRRDVPDRHPAGVEAEDLVVRPRQPRLTLGHEPGLEAALAIPRGLDLNRAQIGADRLAPRAVAHVSPPAPRRPADARDTRSAPRPGQSRSRGRRAGSAGRPDR